MCKVYQKKHLNLWSTCFLLTEIIYSFLKKFEDTTEDIENCKSRDGNTVAKRKKEENKLSNDLQNTTQKTKIEQHERH